ncbi:MAG: hypothetical protein JXB26_14055 [Candidatus Aminicenantes bacterium]|nr:hypothetical protein [Candidatus Aminicenantes bacterium]
MKAVDIWKRALVVFFILGVTVKHLFGAGAGIWQQKSCAESWMGVFMEEIKVGYIHRYEETFLQEGKELRRAVEESLVRVSRLGGNPIVMDSRQESVYGLDGRPLTSILCMKLAQNVIKIKAEIKPREVVFFMAGRKIKSIFPEEKFYLASPLAELSAQGKLRPGKDFQFKVLDFVTQSLTDCTLKVENLEDILIRGEPKKLWHIREQIDSAVPVFTEEWIDHTGNIWKSISRTSMLTTTSLRMNREEALRPSGETYDIAFSSIIPSDVKLPDPRNIRKAVFRLSGLPSDRIIAFPFDDGSQEVLEKAADYVVIQTSAVTLPEKESPLLPFSEENLRPFLSPTVFCPSDDPRLRKKAEEIVGEERNAWKAAQSIALWVKGNVSPNYDVGFASAEEVLQNLEGDCSEFTVLTVALCRAAGIPARAAVGIMYADGFFAYHMWPEIYAGKWLNLDPKWMVLDNGSGAYITDATHIKFGRSILDTDLFKEMARSVSDVIGRLELQVVEFVHKRKDEFFIDINIF